MATKKKQATPGIGIPASTPGTIKNYSTANKPPGDAKSMDENLQDTHGEQKKKRNEDERKKRADDKLLATARKRFKRCLEA